MASVFRKRDSWWCRLKGSKVPGKWSSHPTYETDREKALRYAESAQKAIDKRLGLRTPGSVTLREWLLVWLPLRKEAGHDWKKDRGRLKNHVLPALGGLELPDVTTASIADLVHELRFRKKLANRTVRNIYSTLAAAMRDAAIAGKIAASPCILTDVQLGPIIDSDPEWRDGALFTRDEAEALINDPRIPLDRRIVYAFGLLAGLRLGEIAALRWRHYDATYAPLGKLTVAKAYSTSHSVSKGTKTNAVKLVPVHATLAEMLLEWRKATTWGTEPDDLIVPLPPDVKRTRRTGDRFRGWDYTGRRWREMDLPMLGWRARSVYDTRATFITLALEDGADRDILRERVTHTKPRRDAFDGYDRGERWAETCREVSRLRLRRLVTTVLPPDDLRRRSKLRRRVSNGQLYDIPTVAEHDGRSTILTEHDLARSQLVASLEPLSDLPATLLR